jgi:hypothetical protein
MRLTTGLAVSLLGALLAAGTAEPAPGAPVARTPGGSRLSSRARPARQQPAFDDWADDFSGERLDETKWERFSFQGAGGKVEVAGGQVRLRSGNETRAGIRSRRSFTAERFSAEARLARVAPQLPEPGKKGGELGFASLAILFDGSGRNRVEWILTTEGTFEAWSVVDGQSERLDNRKLGTKIKNPVLGLVRRGDEFLFVLNGPDSPPAEAQVGLRKTIKNLPNTFHVMLYGFGSSQNDWDAVRVVTLK